ncbi:ATP-binding protein [Thermococcus barossii]|uniref:Helicase HerA central domain-containing protein n=1 Tax=Thermococcus barossii TaxID=54077 RepID=A0A2Z2MBF4_9EURY|nr:ATP-binding protein [Thermococcus barossii]ASJ03940.1 hypothetical protein A3L01_00620 [Thermococcus barossii]
MTKLEKFEFLKINGKEVSGTLMKIEPSENTRYSYEVWFPYALEYINEIREGRFLAVKNFATKDAEEHWSILEVTFIEPLHYAIHNISKSHYPHFAETAAKNASIDWEIQTDAPKYPTTRIIVDAIPTNLEIVDDGSDKYELQEETNIPMLGKEVYILDNETTQEIINKGMNKGYIEAGSWTIGNEVKIRINVEELLRKHFGIFGFTGAGKSNLLSTLIRKITEYSIDNEPVKLVIWDLMSEYYGLLLDVLCKYDGYLIAIGEKTFPDSTLEYLKTKDSSKLTQAAEDLVKTMVFPKDIKNNSNIFPKAAIEITKKLLKCDKVRLLVPEYTVDDLVHKYPPWEGRRKGAGPWQTISKVVGRTFGEYRGKDVIVTPELAEKLLNKLESELRGKSEDIKESFGKIKLALENIKTRTGTPMALGITTSQIIELLNSKDNPNILIFVSHDPNQIRNTSWELGTRLYEERRKNGVITPTTVFIFDEADEFIPQDVDKRNESYKHSSDIAMKLARRGRKFGLGLGIATQRIRYLNTSILAQPHTYFVSKLPRKTDREAVAEAFGLGLDMFNQTFKFKKGDWLVISHDALGMEAVPIPVHFENANIKVIEFLNNLPEHCCGRTEVTD